MLFGKWNFSLSLQFLLLFVCLVIFIAVCESPKHTRYFYCGLIELWIIQIKVAAFVVWDQNLLRNWTLHCCRFDFVTVNLYSNVWAICSKCCGWKVSSKLPTKLKPSTREKVRLKSEEMINWLSRFVWSNEEIVSVKSCKTKCW